MKQTNENYKEFFDKYGFTKSMTKPHPIFKDTMEFTGLECDYVNSLERKVDECEKYIKSLIDKIDWLQNRDFYLVKKGLEKENNPS